MKGIKHIRGSSMDEVSVSVIIPAYNVEKYIAECVGSAQNQTLKEIEIICVNDGCSDNTMQIVNTMALKDKRIKIVNKMNEGQSSARNTGIKEARGTYVLFLDSDDYILPETLEELYIQAVTNDLDCVYFDANVFFESETVRRENKAFESYYIRNKNYVDIYNGMELFCKMCFNNDFRPSPCLQLIRRAALKENQITFYNGIIHEDNLFSFQVMMFSRKVMYRKKAYYMRRVREESIMTSKQPIISAYGYYICIIEIERMLEKQHFSRYELMAVEKFLAGLQTAAMNALTDQTDPYEFFVVLDGYPACHIMGLILRIYESQTKVLVREKAVQTVNERFEHSISYRVGLAVTYVPRKIYHVGNVLIKSMKGMAYQLYQFRLMALPAKVCVSIIIPVYNASKYIHVCMESLLCQTLRNIEIICVNDGSTDNSLEILKEYQQRDHRITVVEQENQGAGCARNNGMMHASGEYVLFLDADDFFDPELCSLAYYHAASRRAQVCLFKADRVDMQNGKKQHMHQVFCEKEMPGKVFSAMDIKEKIFQITTACPWSKLFEREFIAKNHLQFQNLKNSNDVLFVRTACALADRITYAQEKPLVTYRYNEKTSTQGKKSLAPLEFYAAFKALKTQLMQRNVYQSFEKSFVNMLLAECLFNFDTAGSTEARELVRETLAKEIFPFFELEKYDRSYFYNQRNYEIYEEIIKNSRYSVVPE